QGGKIGHLRRDRATGTLTPAAPIAATVGSLSLRDVAVAAGGGRAAAAAGDTSGGGRVQLFARDGSGSLSPLACADESATATCTEVDGIGGAAAVALAPAGPGIYVAGELGGGDGTDADALGDGALAALGVEPFVQLSCIPAVPATAAGDACAVAGAAAQPAVAGARTVAVSPDGADVYAGGFQGIAGYARDTGSGRLGPQVRC